MQGALERVSERRAHCSPRTTKGCTKATSPGEEEKIHGLPTLNPREHCPSQRLGEPLSERSLP